MIWAKADEAARLWCGDISTKALYSAVKAGRLKAARIGAGRNLLFCERWCDDWLLASVQKNAPAVQAEARGTSKEKGDEDETFYTNAAGTAAGLRRA